ncbi:MAG: S8 family serine peptidase [Crocosphaera sp.]|nr:S8 family serine peptidase [Crocosphaera sp.]MDJ0728468.1 S8 family serine peptidase [Crocosphaera sp.]
MSKGTLASPPEELDIIANEQRETLERIYKKVIDEPEHLNKKDKIEIEKCEKESLKTLNKVVREKSIELDDSKILSRKIRFYIEQIQRIVTLFAPSDEYDFEKALMWIYEHGGEYELNILQKIKEEPRYESSLLDVAIKEISARLYKRYRVFCSENDLEKLPPEVEVIKIYSCFAIIATTEETINQIKESFPVEPLNPSSKNQVPNSEETMPDQRDQVIYFNMPILDDWKRQIEDLGTTILRPIGRREIVVSVPNQDIVQQIKDNVEGVEDIKPYIPRIRVNTQNLQNFYQTPANATEEDLKKAIAEARIKAARSQSNNRRKKNTIPGILIADFFTEDDRNQGAQELENKGIRIANCPGKTTLVIDVSKDANALESFQNIAQLTGLQSLEEETIPRLFNEQARYIVAKNVIPSNPHPQLNDLDLTGQGEKIAIADTGLDTGDIKTVHPDFKERVQFLKSYTIVPTTLLQEEYISNFGHQDPPIDQHSGHGTHVAGSALGDGNFAEESGISIKPAGMATKAKLIFQALEQMPEWNLQGILWHINTYGEMPPKSGLYGIPTDLKDLFQEAYDQGARIHSNSWGRSNFGQYDLRAFQLDQFVWKHKDFLVVVAAGNDGQQSSSGTGIDLGSVGSPGTAKNCLTVGASENQRDAQFPDTYGQRWPDKFPYDPIKSDKMADSIDDIAAISSRGPCQDGRRKPDLMAPGTFILSTRSSQIAEYDFDGRIYPNAPKHYMYDHGTSMATPLVAGCAALVRQYLREKENIANPSAALVKGILIHSAQYINYRFKHPLSKQWADNEQGWGRVNLSQVLNPPSPTKVQFIDETKGLNTNEFRKYQINIIDTSVILKVTLVYSDYPGEGLYNNLNLMLFSPSGKYYLGNDFEKTGNLDTTNNVEGIVVESPEVGEWKISVIGSDVSEGPQDYALVISGGIEIN